MFEHLQEEDKAELSDFMLRMMRNGQHDPPCQPLLRPCHGYRELEDRNITNDSNLLDGSVSVQVLALQVTSAL